MVWFLPRQRRLKKGIPFRRVKYSDFVPCRSIAYRGRKDNPFLRAAKVDAVIYLATILTRRSP
jgi:hypothetical protein